MGGGGSTWMGEYGATTSRETKPPAGLTSITTRMDKEIGRKKAASLKFSGTALEPVKDGLSISSRAIRKERASRRPANLRNLQQCGCGTLTLPKLLVAGGWTATDGYGT